MTGNFSPHLAGGKRGTVPIRLGVAIGIILSVLAGLLTSTSPARAATSGPCDIYAAGGTPCVAAHSTVRALYGAYNGTLYQVRRSLGQHDPEHRRPERGRRRRTPRRRTRSAPAPPASSRSSTTSPGTATTSYQGSGGAGGTGQPRQRDQRVAHGRRRQGLLAVHQAGQQLLARRLHLRDPDRQRAAGRVHGDQRHARQRRLLLRLRQQRDRPQGRRRRRDGRHQLQHQLLVRRMLGHRPLGQADLEYGLYPGGSQSWNPNQRAFTNRYVTAMLKNNGTTQLRPQGRQRAVRRLTTFWNGALPPRLQPDEEAGRHRAGQRRRLLRHATAT